MKTIYLFTGQNRFLSNFWSCCIAFDGYSYRTVEHAFQAAKTLDEDVRRRIRSQPDAAEARRIGKTVDPREDWGSIKVDVMRQLLRQKFGTNPLRARLLRTGKMKLVEGNWWGDTFWGVYDGKGENRLGLLLMEIREELRQQEQGRRSGS